MRRFKNQALDILREDRAYLIERASALQAVRDWPTNDILDAINQAMLNLNRAYANIESSALIEFAPDGFWMPRCPTCDGSGCVTVVTERESSFDFSTGQDRDVEVCPVCGLGAA